MNKNSILMLIIALTFTFNGISQELPKANPENSFYLLPIFEHIRVPGHFTDEEREFQVLKMVEQMGEGNLYHRLGFSFIYSPNVDYTVRKYCEIAHEKGLHAGLIFALQSHTRNDYRKVADRDLRLYQWRMDGNDWKGAYTSTGEIEVPEDERDYKIPTNSRYARELREYNFGKARDWAESALGLMKDYPGVVSVINGPIEEELAIGGRSNNGKLADYSPYAITEFRDWLRHSGMYDASSGEYAGEGAPESIIGELIDFNGTLRSQFYDDPTPLESNGTGECFNDFFGTAFRSWTLKYWDLHMYPDPVTDVNFDPTPEEGEGYCFGGFDAPRKLVAGNKFWKAWSWDIPDQAGLYPPGNPENPAFGFRQNMVRNFVRDLFDIMADAGLPREIMYAHQIPGEALGNFTGAGGRNRSSASTVWTGYMEKSQNVGITRFGDIDPGLMTQYADDWGIFEWHTKPNSFPNSIDLYEVSRKALNLYYKNGCHILFPGWWQVEKPVWEDTFPLNDSQFANAIADFMKSRKELPYHQKIDSTSFTPPQVKGLSVSIDKDSAAVLKWSSKIWADLPADWKEWDDFSHFEIQTSPDKNNWSLLDTTSNYLIDGEKAAEEFYARVRAISLSGEEGAWSEEKLSVRYTASATIQINAEFDTLFADPAVGNTISIELNDANEILDRDSLFIEISGEGGIMNTLPIEADSIEKFWPMNSIDEVAGLYKVDKLSVKGGVLFGKVSPEEPIDPYFSLVSSNVNGSELPYISFRLYSGLPTTGQLYWFYEGGFSSTTYALEQGWNTVYLDTLPEWINQTKVNSVRLDPGTTASSEIMLDWFAISSKKLSGELKSVFGVEGNVASAVTVANPGGGNYKIDVRYKGIRNSFIVYTSDTNIPPVVSFLAGSISPESEKGKSKSLKALAEDIDGVIKVTGILINDSVWFSYPGSELDAEWVPADTGIYLLQALAVDNAGDTARSDTARIRVFSQFAFGDISVLPGIIEAENYDFGGNGISWYDMDSGNKGGVYREDDVDIDVIAGQAENYQVFSMEKGEWLEYSFRLDEKMKVSLQVLAKAESGGGEFHFEMDDIVITNRLQIGESDGFEYSGTKDIFLPSGLHRLKFVVDEGGFSLDHIGIQEYDITGLNDVVPDEKVILYPNPAKDVLLVKTSAAKFEIATIYSVSGRQVKTLKLMEGERISIPLGELSSGLYFIRLQGDKKAVVRKFIKAD